MLPMRVGMKVNWVVVAGLVVMAVLTTSPALAERPDIVWMAGGHAGYVFSFAFSPDGRTLASGSSDRTIKLWDVSDPDPNNWQLLRTLTGHTDYVYSVAFAPDGRTLASGSQDDKIKLWDVSDPDPNNWQLLRTLTGHRDGVSSVAFAPDGRTLASGGTTGGPNYDGEIKFWDVSDPDPNNWKLLLTLTGHASYVYSVAFSPDGRTLASVGGTKIALWDVSDGALLKTYDQETGTGVLSAQYSPDGRYFAYGRDDATIVVARNPFWKGDLNCDGNVDFGDINPFIKALANPVGYQQQFPDCDIMNGDINVDGYFDFGDINPFIELLAQ